MSCNRISCPKCRSLNVKSHNERQHTYFCMDCKTLFKDKNCDEQDILPKNIDRIPWHMKNLEKDYWIPASFILMGVMSVVYTTSLLYWCMIVLLCLFLSVWEFDAHARYSTRLPQFKGRCVSKAYKRYAFIIYITFIIYLICSIFLYYTMTIFILINTIFAALNLIYILAQFVIGFKFFS